MKEALKQIVYLLEPVAALADGTPFEHSEVIQRCVDATEIALEALAQPAPLPYMHSQWQETIAGIPVTFESEADAKRFLTTLKAKLKELNT